MLPEKVLVANRGAIARRVIEACERLGIQSVAVFSEADATAPYLAEASEALALPGNSAAETYLNQPALLAALDASGADAVQGLDTDTGISGWGEGSLKYIVSTRKGNSLDIATAFVGLSRLANGLPP